MHITKKIHARFLFSSALASLIAALVFCAVLPAAQALVLPSVGVAALNASQQPGSTSVTGSLMVTDRDTTSLNDLSYSAMLTAQDPASHQALFYYEVFFPTFALNAGQQSTLNFSYPIPAAVTSGTYTLVITLTNSTGLVLGTARKSLQVTTPNAQSVIASDAAIVLPSGKHAPLEGPTIPEGSAPQAAFTVSNKSNQSIALTPDARIYKRAPGGNYEERTGAEVTIPAHDSMPVQLDLPSYTDPESYLAVVTLKDASGTTASNTLYFRWVVGGVGGHVLMVSAPTNSLTAGQCTSLPITVTYSKSADGNTPIPDEQVNVTASDSESGKVLGNATGMASSSGATTLTVPLSHCASAVSVSTSLMSGSTTLDTYVTTLTGTSAPQNESWAGALTTDIIAGALLILAVLALVYINRRSDGLKMLVIIVIASSSFLFIHTPHAAAMTVETQDGAVAVSWNLPLHNQVFRRGDSMTVDTLFQLVDCFNTVTSSVIKVYYQYPDGSDDPKTLPIQTLTFNDGHESTTGLDCNNGCWDPSFQVEDVNVPTIIPSTLPLGLARVYIDATFTFNGNTHYWRGYETIDIEDSSTDTSHDNNMTVRLVARPTTIARGDSSTLTWTSQNADYCQGDLFNTNNTSSGSVLVSPNDNTTYALTCYNNLGPAQTFASVDVTDSAITSNDCVANQNSTCTSPPNACGMTRQGTILCNGECSVADNSYSDDICSPLATGQITATPASVHQGGSTKVTWTSEYTEDCTVTGSNGFSDQDSNGTKADGPITGPVTYTLQCQNMFDPADIITAMTKVRILPVWKQI